MLQYFIFSGIFTFFLHIIHILGTYNFYKKFRIPFWKIIIPVYNIFLILKKIHRPIWWIFLLFIPLTNIVLLLIIWLDLIRYLHKIEKKDIIIFFLSAGLYIYYINIFKKIDLKKEKKIENHEGILLSLILSFITHTYVIQPFVIPTSSMEKSLLVGDFILVSKIHYGLRMPISPICLPFFHNNIIGLKSYIDIQFPYFRLPPIKPIQRNDVVVFNFPKDLNHKILDRKDHYVKRCVGIPGDIILIKKGVLFINHKKEKYFFNKKQQSYFIKTKNIPLNLEFLKEKMDIEDVEFFGEKNDEYFYQIMLTEEKAIQIKKLFNDIIFIEKNIYPKGVQDPSIIFSNDFRWNRDFFGPLYIPKKGDIIKINSKNIHIYNEISCYEGEKKENFIRFLGKNYKIKKNYYFMIGDNRHNSFDSRYWGFVPEDYIVGKPILIWMSIDWDRKNPMNIFHWKFRLDRIMTTIDR